MADVKPVEKVKKAKKVAKVVEGTIITFTAGDKVVKYDLSKLSQVVKDHLVMHGFSQKLGDSYAGAATAAEALESLEKVYAGLLRGDWSVRVIKGEKVSKSSILENYNGLSEAEKKIAAPFLKKLGLIA